MKAGIIQILKIPIMKKISAAGITGIILLIISFCANAQLSKPVIVIEPYKLNITYAKTTNLIFPFNIQSVDRGSRDVLAQKAKGVENILEVKAGKRGFEETNLTVVTTDGKLYSYLVNYVDTPAVLNLQFSKAFGENPADLSGGLPNTEELQIISGQVVGQQETACGKHAKKYGVKLQLKGIYIYDDIFYYQFTIRNSTNIDYGIDQFRFFIRDQKKVKRTAAQELELTPVFINGDTSSVAGHSEKILVFALRKFTIPDQKYLEIQVMEKDGGRHLEIRASNDDLVEAKSL
jgi:conjugative transposon TraN protein